MSYLDITTDILVFLEFIHTNPSIAYVQGGSLAFALVMHAFFSLAFGQPLWVATLGLIGMKPLVEAWRDATDAKPFPGQKIGNDGLLVISRCNEVIAEAIPQSLIQCYALFVYPEQRTFLQFFSLTASFATTGFTVASADRDFDKSKFRRRTEPELYGYV